MCAGGGAVATIRFRVSGPGSEPLEIAAAEAWEAGALGVEEHDDAIIVHVERDAAQRVRAAIEAVAGVHVGAEETVPDRDWSEAWKDGLEPIDVSDRLLVCPSFVDRAPRPGQQRIVVDPGQAFGTGHHGSTALALGWLDRVVPGRHGVRVLDVGCGTGLLAIAALALGARRAVACDLDPLATQATVENAARNDCTERVATFTGSTSAVAAGTSFECVVANMIRSELVPILGDLTGSCAPGGDLVLSGLLRTEEAEMTARLAERGFRVAGTSGRLDERGDDWLGIHATDAR